MTTKDWQSEVEAAADDTRKKLQNIEAAHYEYWIGFQRGFRTGASWAREKLALATTSKNTSSIYEREAKLVEALEAIEDHDEVGIEAGKIARAALKDYWGEK